MSVQSETEAADRIQAVGYDYSTRAKERVAECNLCGSSWHVEIGRRDRYGFDTRLQLCARCGLAFISPRLTPEEYKTFYRAFYRPLVSAFKGVEINRETLQEGQEAYAREIVEFLVPRVGTPPSSIVDVGGSTGVVAAVLCEEFGSIATVLDPSPEELSVAQEAGLETVEGLVEDYDPGERRWDLVVLCQTIDHLLDVRGTLERLRSMVSPDGSLYIDVVDLLFAMRRMGAIEGAVKIDHPYYLTRATAMAYFRSVGLEVVSEHVSDDAHLFGFLLRIGEPREPEWDALSQGAAALLDEVSRMRAAQE